MYAVGVIETLGLIHRVRGPSNVQSSGIIGDNILSLPLLLLRSVYSLQWCIGNPRSVIYTSLNGLRVVSHSDHDNNTGKLFSPLTPILFSFSGFDHSRSESSVRNRQSRPVGGK